MKTRRTLIILSVVAALSLPTFGATDVIDADLQAIIDAWPALPEVARAGILAMVEAAAGDGVTLLIVSGFRSYEYQAALIRKKINAGQSITDILEVNAAPGHSEHHTGLAVDIATPGSRPLTEEFEDSAAFRWLQANAERFGFSMSYPRDNPWGIVYEPWHWAMNR